MYETHAKKLQYLVNKWKGIANIVTNPETSALMNDLASELESVLSKIPVIND